MAEQGIATYLHALDGRIRVKRTLIKGAPHKAVVLEQQLRAYSGIAEVTANPITGSVLVLYDPQQLEQQEVFDLLRAVNCFPEEASAAVAIVSPPKSVAEFGQGLLRTVATATVEFAVQRLVYAIL